MQRSRVLRRIRQCALLALVAGALVASCGNPLEIDTPRRIIRINYDSLVAIDTAFRTAPGDSIFAAINNEAVVFATGTRERTIWHNGIRNGAYFIAVKGLGATAGDENYETIALRIDMVRDTGTYAINAPYYWYKGELDTLTVARNAAEYERTIFGLKRTFRTGQPGTSGKIRVLVIDTTAKVMIGTFSFTAHADDIDSTVDVTRGAFRLRLD